MKKNKRDKQGRFRDEFGRYVHPPVVKKQQRHDKVVSKAISKKVLTGKTVPKKIVPKRQSPRKSPTALKTSKKRTSRKGLSKKISVQRPVQKKPISKSHFVKKLATKNLLSKSLSKKPAKKKLLSQKPPLKKSLAKKPTAKSPVAKKPLVKKALPKKPISKKPVAKKPVAKKPVAKKPVAKKPVAKKPVAKKPVAKKPVAKKPVAKKPVAKKLTAKKPAAKKPVSKKPAPKKSAPKKPAPKKSVAKKPVSKRPTPKRRVPKRPKKRKPKKPRFPAKLPSISQRSAAAEREIQERIVVLMEAIKMLQSGLNMSMQTFVNLDGTVDGELRLSSLPREWKDEEGLPELIATLSNAFQTFPVFDRHPAMGGSFWFSVAVRFGPENEAEMGELAELYKRHKGLFQIGTYPTRADHATPLQLCLTDDRMGLRGMIGGLEAKRGLPPTSILMRFIWGPDWNPDVSGKRPTHYQGEKGDIRGKGEGE